MRVHDYFDSLDSRNAPEYDCVVNIHLNELCTTENHRSLVDVHYVTRTMHRVKCVIKVITAI